ncbi:MAG: GntR family transcriptional regulator [bacterium]
MSLDRTSVLPLYHQIKEQIRERIAKGKYAADERVPSENELATHYRVSRNTAKQAIADLVSEGILFREQGRGTFVSPRKMFLGIGESFSFYDEISKSGRKLTTRILAQKEMSASLDTAQVLKIAQRDPIFVLRRLRLLDDKPFSLQVSFIPKVLCPTLFDFDLEKESLFAVLSKQFDLVPLKAEEYLECQPASDYESEPMQVEKGTPLFHLHRITHDTEGRVMEVVRTYLPIDQCRFHFLRANVVEILVHNSGAKP